MFGFFTKTLNPKLTFHPYDGITINTNLVNWSVRLSNVYKNCGYLISSACLLATLPVADARADSQYLTKYNQATGQWHYYAIYITELVNKNIFSKHSYDYMKTAIDTVASTCNLTAIADSPTCKRAWDLHTFGGEINYVGSFMRFCSETPFTEAELCVRNTLVDAENAMLPITKAAIGIGSTIGILAVVGAGVCIGKEIYRRKKSRSDENQALLNAVVIAPPLIPPAFVAPPPPAIAPLLGIFPPAPEASDETPTYDEVNFQRKVMNSK